jgi:hypothetical protein
MFHQVNFNEAYPNTTFHFKTMLSKSTQTAAPPQPSSGVPMRTDLTPQELARNSHFPQQIVHISTLQHQLLQEVMQANVNISTYRALFSGI